MSNMETDKSCLKTEHNTNIPSRAEGCTNAGCPSLGATGCTCRIRELNDQLRTRMCGGLVHMTNGIAALGLARVNAIFAAVSKFSVFSDDNDPWREHDCAVMEVEGHRIIWKIDYYDRSRSHHSPDAADPKVTVRVLTVMLAGEY